MFARFARPTARRRDARRRPLCPAIDDRRGANVRGAVDAERHYAAAKRAEPRRDPRIVGVGDEQVRRSRGLEDFGLRVGDRVDRREEADVRVADVRPHAHVGLGDAHERADLSCVVHPQFDDGDLRPLPQLDEGQRQPDVVVQVSPVANHAVARAQQLAGHFLRRRLARAPRNRDDLRARLASNRAPQRLKRQGRVVDLDDDRSAASLGSLCSLA
jgi:hypothetical protein